MVLDGTKTEPDDQAVPGSEGTPVAVETKELAVASQRPWYHPRTILQYWMDNWLLIGIALAIIFAWRWPHVAAHGGIIESQWSIEWGSIGGIFLITGFILSTQALIDQFTNWRLHLVTTAFSFLFFSAVVFALVNIIRASHNGSIDPFILVGLIAMSCMPTTVASNITMTRFSGGSEEAATTQVCLGNLLGIFFAPLLVEMYTSAPGWEFGRPVATGGLSSSAGLQEIYKRLIKQMTCTIFAPLIVGQAVRWFFSKQVTWLVDTFRLKIFSTLLLLTLNWSVFSTQFENHAFDGVSHASIILVVLMGFGLYLFFTLMCVVVTRLPFLPKSFDRPAPASPEAGELESYHIPAWRRCVLGMRFTKSEAIAICFCAAAKGLVVGTPMTEILYGGVTAQQRAIITVPLVLYQGIQVVTAQFLTQAMKMWNARPDAVAESRKRGTSNRPIPEKHGGTRASSVHARRRSSAQSSHTSVEEHRSSLV